MVIATLAAAAMMPATSDAVAAPTVFLCVFPKTIPSTRETPRDEFVVYLPAGAKAGLQSGIKVNDPARLLRGGVLDRVDLRANAVSVLGPNGTPKPFLSVMIDKKNPDGSYGAAIDFLDDDAHQRLGACGMFNGTEAARLVQPAAPAENGAPK